MSVSERDYLSIGEVLALLQEEFPDVTISKIRFLESQGLIEPERTHSGYRKFFGADVERLRFILREQREKYLPLRVIRDRLDAGPGDGAATDASTVATADGAATGGAAPDAEAGSAQPPGADERDGGTSATAGAEPVPEPHVPLWLRKAPPGVVRHQPLEPAAAAATATPGADAPPAAEGTPQAPPVPVLTLAAASSAAPSTGAAAAVPAPEPGGGAAPVTTDLQLTLDELAAASGLDAAVVRDLERYGLLAAHAVGRVTYYDGEALQAARLAKGFLAHGIEPRHLRMYKTFVEREAGLFEQVILPLMKQRNPQARVQATEALHELAGHGAALRALLVGQAMRALEP